jgi:5-methylthioribose kinase
MIEIDSRSAADYLRDTGRVAAGEPIEVRELSGGVSNVVLLITLPGRGAQFVLKQARGQLRVKEDWFCPIERIWREVEVLKICSELLQRRSAERGVRNEDEENKGIMAHYVPCVPQVLWEDRDNYLYAMTAAHAGHQNWKEMLLAGNTQRSIDVAATCGQLLARLHAGSWLQADIAARLDDRAYFDRLRLDPYYRHAAHQNADLGAQFGRLIDSVWNNRRCLVHGDYSPKNLLVWPGHLMLIDFEVGHFGDPAFDLGFFLTHLVLKSIWSGRDRNQYLRLATGFWNTYRRLMTQVISADEIAALEERMLANLAGCMLARVDGKSPVEYLTPQHQETTRRLARAWVAHPPSTWEEALKELEA